jgi:hypothetical protein
MRSRIEVEAVIVNDEPEALRAPAADVGDRDVLVILERLREADDFLLE